MVSSVTGGPDSRRRRQARPTPGFVGTETPYPRTPVFRMRAKPSGKGMTPRARSQLSWGFIAASTAYGRVVVYCSRA